MENRIREIRQSIGMTLQQVADRAGTTKAQVMKLEKGDRRLTDTWMVRLSLAMSCDPKELMGTIRDSRHLPEEETAEAPPPWRSFRVKYYGSARTGSTRAD